MSSFLTIILIGISLSMDAFSLALIYGTYGLSSRRQFMLSVIVGCFHFFMPLIGYKISNILSNYIIVDLNILVAIIPAIAAPIVAIQTGKTIAVGF